MQELIYNSKDLAALGQMRILGHSTVREPAEAPQRERVTYRVRIDFFEQSFKDNYTLIEEFRTALKTQNAALLWKDSGTTLINRTVTAMEDQSPEEVMQRGGTYHQAVIFSFWFYNHDVVTNCLNATYTQTGGGPLDFGAVEKFEESLNITRVDDLRDPRKLVQGRVVMTGRFQSDTKQLLATRRDALLALKDAMFAAIAAKASGTLQFATFNRSVRVTEFKADTDQPANFIAWSLAATYTVYPNEANYSLVDVKVTTRESQAEGIQFLTIAGRIQALTEAAARARLATLRGSLVPTGYVILSEEITVPKFISESGGVNQGDGAVFTEISFTLEYRSTAGIVCGYQRSGANTVPQDLGTVDKFRDAYSSNLFDDLRSNRKRAGGMVTLAGAWYVVDAMSEAEKQAALIAKYAALMIEVTRGSSGTLTYGAAPNVVFNQLVRIVDFTPEIDHLKNCIHWTMTGSFTRYPNESDYALCEFRLGTRQDRTEGIIVKTLAGRIGAPTPELARAKLASMRTALIPVGYVLKTDSSEESRVDVESGKTGGNNVGDGATFIELTINEEWQKASSSVLSHKLRRVDDDDIKSGWIHTTFSGNVQAAANTAATAFAAAEARAASLGAGKYPFVLRTSVTESSNQVLTDGLVIVTVEFAYEYQRKGTKIYTEVTSELSEETFGHNVETVTGSIMAASLAIAQATYATDVRNVASYSGALILNERQPTLSEQRLDDELSSFSALHDRFAFSFQVFREKSETQTSIRYTTETSSNVQTVEKVTNIRGVVYAASEAVANAFLDTFLTGLGVGKRVNFSRLAQYQQGAKVVGADKVTAFLALDFNETFVTILTGVDGILDCECTEEMTYSGDRVLVKGIPTGPPVIQKPGRTEARRVVTARCRATTEAAGLAWVKKIRAQFIKSGNELPPQVTTNFKFLPQTDGTPRGTPDDAMVFEVSGTFSEVIQSLAFN